MTTTNDPTIVRLNCAACAGPIEVAYDPDADGELQTIRFVCPYCETPREIRLPGRARWVAMRQHGEGPETRH
jgi:hypothetical protein